VSVEARQLVLLYLSIDQEAFDSGTCGQWDWNVRERHHAWSAVLDKWSVAHGQAIRHAAFHENFVIPTSKSVWKYMGSE
jgi:hypothetical protein